MEAAMAASSSESVPQSGDEKTAVWRIDRETKQIITNKEYLKKYPRTGKKGAEDKDNGEAPKKRRKKLELKATGDPIAELAQDEANGKNRIDEDAKKDKKEAKKEKKEAKKAKEEVKDEEKVKDEVKEEIKEEIKEEVKEEKDDEGKPDESLDNLFADVEEKKQKKRKHDTRSVLDQDNGPPPDVEYPTSDTEYEESDPAKCPSGIVVEASGNPKLDGRYDILPKNCRGRPSYFKRKNDKIMYIYTCRKSQHWKIGFELGSDKNLARVKDVPSLSDCLEPYPHSWQVYDKEANTFPVVLSMRVYDLKSASAQLQLPEPLLQADSLTKSPTAGGDGEGVERKSKAAKREKKEKKEKEKEEAGKEGATGEDGVKKEEEGVKDEKADVKQEAQDDKPDKESDSDSSSKSSSSEEESSSDGEDNAGGDDGEGTSPKKPSQAEEDARALRRKEAEEAQKAQKAADFIAKLRGEVEKIPDDKARNKKVDQIKNMLQTRKASLQKAAGMDEEKINDLISSLERDFVTNEAPKKAPRQPGGPPPQHLMEKSVKAPRGPPPKHLLEKGQVKREAEGDTRLNNAPTTPPDQSVGGEPTHRTAEPVRGVLRGRGASRRPRAHRLSTTVEFPLTHEAVISSYRPQGELLWFQAPGSVVLCDHCERGVPQSMGALQGAPGQSQFAQCEFFCSDCMQIGPQG